MTRRFAALALSASLLVTVFASTPVAAVSSAPIPTSMAAVGDSITQAASSAGALGSDAPHNSWSTGTSTTVYSHFLRLRELSPNLVAYNRSVSGAKVGDLNGQMLTVAALAPDPGYLTVLIGGNDLCTNTVTEMTSVDDFRTRFTQAMQTITTQSSGTYVYVVSIPDVWQLWNLFKGSFWARFVWASANICQSLLANPGSNQTADVTRRELVRQQNIAFNGVMKQVCESQTFAARCHFDNNAAFNTQFTRSDVSGDYFHPSAAGQAKLAATSWTHGYAWMPNSPINRAPTASISVPSSCTADVACSGFSAAGSSDLDGDPLTYTWSFGDGTTAIGVTATHTYTGSTGSPYPVTLTVSDGKLSDVKTAHVAVGSPPTGLQLQVLAYKVKGLQHADLSWSGATSTNVDVFRNGVKVTTTPNDGAHMDNIGAKGGGSYTYTVCEAGTSTCSPVVSVSY